MTRTFKPLLPVFALLGVVALGVAVAVVTPHRPEEIRRLFASPSRDAFPRSVQSADGETVSFAQPPRRVIALSLPVEEVLLDIAGPAYLAAVTPFVRDPEYSHVAKLAQRVPETVTSVDLERIVRLAPDLVFAASYTGAGIVTHLRNCGVPVCVLPAVRSTTGVRALVELIGFVLGLEAEAGARLEAMDTVLKTAQRRLELARTVPGWKPPRVLYLDLPAGQLADAWTTGAETLLDDVLRHAGAVNVAAEAGIRHEKSVTAEAVLRWDPNWLLMAADGKTDLLETLRKQPVLSAARAVREGRLLVLPAASLTCTSHFWVGAVRRLIEQLYP